MTTATKPPATRRITVTLDASESGRPPLETAARLAAILGAELEGVFVEDINLIRLSGLPFLRELRSWTIANEQISSQRMQRELRTLARRAEQMLERVARESGVPWSFQVWQGRPEAASLLQAFGAEILSLGRVSTRVSSRMFAPARRPTVLSRETDTTSISVLFSGSEQAARAMATACSLARDMGARLTIMLPAFPAQALPALKEQTLAILKQHGQVARFVELAGVDAQSLKLAADAAGPGILITEAEHPLLQQVGLDQCLDALFCPVLLIR
jgi:nucleotide-binding universal stress UspA family protein